MEKEILQLKYENLFLKRAVLSSRENETRFRDLIECFDTRYIFVSKDITSDYMYVSPSIFNILGYSGDELIKNPKKYLDKKSLKLFIKNAKLVLNGLPPESFNIKVNDHNNVKKILLVVCTQVKGENGISLHCIIRDITHQTEKDVQLKKLSLAVEHSPSMVLITDAAGLIEYINPRFSGVTGYSLEELHGKHPSILGSGETQIVEYEDAWKTLMSGQTWTGMLLNKKKSGDNYWSYEEIVPILDEEQIIINFVSVQEDITEKKRINEEMIYHATHDQLTNLTNRRALENILSTEIRHLKSSDSQHFFCFFDLDRFKVVNDTSGHIAGDVLLRKIGELVKSEVKSIDVVSRLSGDEYGILLKNCTLDNAKKVIERIRNKIELFRYVWEDKTFSVGISAGIVKMDKLTRDFNEVISSADMACSESKKTGRNKVSVYTESDQSVVNRKNQLQWANEIISGIDEKKFILFGQLILAVNDKNEKKRFEVLVRYVSKDGDIVAPGFFLPAAERYNLATKLDQYVVSETLSYIKNNKLILDEVEYLAINLSGQSINDLFLSYLLNELKIDSSISEKVLFEITETAAISDIEYASYFIDTLKENGFRFALDDFGSGMSSFAYLKQMPIDYLKIDGVFIKNITKDAVDCSMIRSINEIGHIMKIKTIAEYVEDDQILTQLQRIGVDYAQGYFIGKPDHLDKVIRHSI